MRRSCRRHRLRYRSKNERKGCTIGRITGSVAQRRGHSECPGPSGANSAGEPQSTPSAAANDPCVTFAAFGDLAVTGPTLTNVNGLQEVIIE
jgi:hypothetical protein